MKKLLFIALVLITMAMNSQTVDGKMISDIDTEFIQIWFSPNYSSVTIHYGQELDLLYGKKSNILDENGKPIKSLSHVPIINMMINNGYEVVDVANSINGGTQHAWVYSFKKKS